MKMKYLTYVNHLSAVLTITMICFQAASFAATAVENHNGINISIGPSSAQAGDLSKDHLNSMTLSELKDVKHQVDQEIRQKYMENLTDSNRFETDIPATSLISTLPI